MQVLLVLGYFVTGSYCLVIGDTLGVSKSATTRVVYRVSKALCALDEWEEALYYSQRQMRMLLSRIKYRITHMLFLTLYAAITNELNFLETLFCIFFKCV